MEARSIAPTQSSTWQIVAELPYLGSLKAVHLQVRKLRHIIVDRFDESKDNAIQFSLRGFRFRLEKVDDRIDLLVNDANCPVDILMEPLCHLVKPLAIKRDTPME